MPDYYGMYQEYSDKDRKKEQEERDRKKREEEKRSFIGCLAITIPSVVGFIIWFFSKTPEQRNEIGTSILIVVCIVVFVAWYFGS